MDSYILTYFKIHELLVLFYQVHSYVIRTCVSRTNACNSVVNWGKMLVYDFLTGRYSLVIHNFKFFNIMNM